MSTCNWLDLETLGSGLDCAQKSPQTLYIRLLMRLHALMATMPAVELNKPSGWRMVGGLS